MAENKHTPWSAEWSDESSDWLVVGSVSEPDSDGITHQPTVCTLSDWFSGDTARLIAAAPDLLRGLIMEVKNCPLCKGDGVTDQTLEHIVELNGKRAGVKTDCPRCKPSRDIIARATQPGEA